MDGKSYPIKEVLAIDVVAKGDSTSTQKGKLFRKSVEIMSFGLLM